MRSSAFAPLLGLIAGCSATQVGFSNVDDLESMVVTEIDAASTSVHTAIYTFTSANIEAALTNAAGRGCEVLVVADAGQSATVDGMTGLLVNLEEAGVDVRTSNGYGDKQGVGIMHHKFTVVDDRVVATGSFNYTDAAKNRNDENLVVLADANLAAAYEDAFQELWSRAQD